MVLLFSPPPFFVSRLNFLNRSPLMGFRVINAFSTFLEWREFFILIVVFLREIIASVFLVPAW